MPYGVTAVLYLIAEKREARSGRDPPYESDTATKAVCIALL